MRRSDVILAFLISPLVAPLTLLAAEALLADYASPYRPITFCLLAYNAYLIALLLGLPAFLLYRALGWRSVTAFALGGALLGLVAALWLFKNTEPAYLAAFELAGGLSALTFRLLLADYYPRRMFK